MERIQSKAGLIRVLKPGMVLACHAVTESVYISSDTVKTVKTVWTPEPRAIESINSYQMIFDTGSRLDLKDVPADCFSFDGNTFQITREFKEGDSSEKQVIRYTIVQ